MEKSKLKTKKNVDKEIGNVIKTTGAIVFFSVWFFLVYHMIFNY